MTALPPAVIDLAARLGAQPTISPSTVTLTQRGKMKRALGKDSWMAFTARQSIDNRACNFSWLAKVAPLGFMSIRDSLDDGVSGLAVKLFGLIPVANAPDTPALVRGELMRYLAELPWAPDAILANPALRWRDGPSGAFIVGAGEGDRAAEVTFTLDRAGRIETGFAPDRPRSPTAPHLPTPWRGRFWDYRLHAGRWIPFAGEVAWEIDGVPELYWRGVIESWSTT